MLAKKKQTQNTDIMTPFATAVVFKLATSLPPPGSLTPIQVTMSPSRAGLKKVSLSSSVPNLANAGVEQSVCTP